MSLHLRPTRLLRYATAEFRRILGSRSYWLYHASILFVALLFAADLFLIAKPASIPPGFGMGGFTHVLFEIWIRGLPLCLVICTSVSWAASDSQHGMVRVVLTQPISRPEFVIGKLLAIGVHNIVLVVSIVLSELIACLVLGGVRGLSLGALAPVAVSMTYAAAVVLVFSWASIAVALIRRTIGSAAVGILVAVFLLALLSYGVSDTAYKEFAPLRYLVLPFRALATTEGRHNYDSSVAFAASLSLWRFCLTALGMTVVFVGGALVHLQRRDVIE
jgi:ABC-type transport system involved in multi-copper enzyme maturation permease subunit